MISIFFAWPCSIAFCSTADRPQEQTAPQPATASQQPVNERSSPPKERKTPRKIWTDEDMGAVKASPVSQVGQSDPKKAGSGASPYRASKSANAQLITTYRQQLARLQAQQALTEKQIDELKDFNRGEPGHDTGMQLHKRYNVEPIDEQIRKLEAKQKQIADQIDTLYDAARKKGIESRQLP